MAPRHTVRLEVVRAAGLVSLALRSRERHLVVPADRERAPPNTTLLSRAAQVLVPDGAVRQAVTLTKPDFFWYGPDTAPQLPVLRLCFDDPSATWLYLDPAAGTVLSRIDRRGRLYRVAYHLLHRWDVEALVGNPPARRAWIWLFSIAGVVTSASGLLLGSRRLTRALPHQLWACLDALRVVRQSLRPALRLGGRRR